jgi:polysaccharide pyruvyl transferase WcaK-like protein
MDQAGPELRIGLLWHSPNSDNLGVGALTVAHLAILDEAARRAGVTPRFVILGWDDPRPPYLHRDDVEIVGLRLRHFASPGPGGLFAQLRRCDVVADIGAGDSFADIYGTKRLLTMLAPKALTVAAGRPLVLAPQTIGPFEGGRARRAALAAIRRAEIVATRDDLSTEFLRGLGFAGEIVAASDVALRLPYAPPPPRADNPVRIGLNVSGLLFNGGYSRSNQFGMRAPYDALVRALLGRLTARSDVEVHLVAHVISDWIEVEDDHRVNLRLAEEFPGMVVAPRFADPGAAKSYIAGMDFFAGARMHACIAAFSSGVPVLPMAYSRKFAGLFGALGYDTLVDCRTDGAEEILDSFDRAFEGRAALKETLDRSLARGLERLGRYEDAIAACLARVRDARQAQLGLGSYKTA